MEDTDLPRAVEKSDLNERVLALMVANQDRVRRLFRRWLIIASLVLVSGVGYVAQTAHEIRATQVRNTSTNQCVARTTNNAVHDVILALVDHDPNKADYKALDDKC